jgi:plasmid maintenance system antidote protein VapI
MTKTNGPATLKAYLKQEHALSQRALARAAGVHQSMISMLARGKRSCRGTLAVKLRALTGVPLEALIVTPRRRSRPKRSPTPKKP